MINVSYTVYMACNDRIIRKCGKVIPWRFYNDVYLINNRVIDQVDDQVCLVLIDEPAVRNGGVK